MQPEYNLYEREKFEKDVRDVCLKNNLGVIVYYPLAAGFLSGKYRNEKVIENKARAGRLKRYLNARGLRIIDALTLIAEQHNAEPAEIALAWVLHQPGITAPIASATSVEQLKSNMKCVQIRLSEKDLKQLDEASA